jgi:superfamily I DNA/RNA helicase
VAKQYMSMQKYFYYYWLQYLHTKDYVFVKNLLYSPVLNISSKTKKKLYQLFRAEKENVISVLKSSSREYIDSSKDIHTILTVLNKLKNTSTTTQIGNLLKLIHAVTEFSYLAGYISQNKNRQQRIQVFMSSMTQFNNKKNPLEKAIQYINYLKNNEFYDPMCDKVTLLTMHASKRIRI